MKKLIYIFAALALALAACQTVETDSPLPEKAGEDAKVAITFPISIPKDGPTTKARGNQPDVKNIYVAVFGGSGYFNEWVPAVVEPADNPPTQFATENEVIYNLKVKLTVSQSRLNLHIIANSPLSEPPITGISSQDLESMVMSKVRSHIDNEPSDAYWGKIVLPYGVQDSMIVTNGVQQPFLVNGDRYPTLLTQSQFTHWSPIPLVRNFARIKVKLAAAIADQVQIDRIGLAYAPAEGPVAPILPNTYTADAWGRPITIADDDEQTEFWNESFYIDYSSKTMEDVGSAPYNYKGYSPADLALGTYPASLEEMTPWSPETDDETFLYVYERAKPRQGQKSTRILIHAKNGSEDWKYYPLDLTDANGEPEVFLRNYTYTVVLRQLAVGTGAATIAAAADATGADVSSDPRTADLTEVSDGYALIAASYIDTTAIKAGVYSVMYRFEPDVTTHAESNNPFTGEEGTSGVTLKIGYNNGVDGFVEGATSANGSAFTSTPTIELNTDGTAKLYVRSGTGYVPATQAQINNPNLEKWSKINYTTATVDRENHAAVDAEGYYTQAFTQTIRIIGTKTDGGQVYRDVQINLTPRKKMIVECVDKYIEEEIGANETVRIYIPIDLTRSMFPMTYKLQPAAGTLNPRLDNNLPVQSGKSLAPGEEDKSVFYFIKMLTRQEYNELPETTIGGISYKYFDCYFTSTVAASATTVYADNDYFVGSSDSFENYTKRLFTAANPGDLGMGQTIEFSFNMDQAHTGAAVWNDETIAAGSRVIPKEVTVTLTGIQPQTDEDGYVDSRLVKGEGQGVYYYHVYEDGQDASDISNRITLHLEAGNADNYSISLSTSLIQPNPKLYETLTLSGDIVKSRITDSGFTNTSGNAITSIPREAGLPVQFRFTYGGALVPVTFKLEGLTTTDTRVSGPDASGYYTFIPTGTATAQIIYFTTTDTDTECQLTNFSIADESYNQPDPNSFSLERRNRRWVTDSYTINLTNSDSYTSAPQNVVFNNVESTRYDYDYDYETGQWVYYYYKSMGTRTGNGGNRRYNNGTFTVTAPSSLTDSRITGIEMTYYSDYYDDRTVTVTGDVTAAQSSAGMTSWSSSSTGEGNGDTTVTVTMSCTSNTEYNARNRLTSVTVYYGYWTED